MTDRLTINQINSDQLDQLYDRLDRAETELQQRAATDSADAAAGSYAHRAEHAEAERDRYRQAILDIDAHATPIGLAHQDDPDGNPHHYAVTVGALHRALGRVGHTAAPCTAEAVLTRIEALAEEYPVGIDTALIHEALAHAEPAPKPAATDTTELEKTTRVIDLYERWLAAGPPPLGTSISRWWDRRLIELHNAIRPAAEQPTKTVNNPATSNNQP